MRDASALLRARPRPVGAETLLSADESHHLARVMRLVAGDELVVFDGRGHEFQARVRPRRSTRAATVALGDRCQRIAEPAVPTVLVQAVLKGDKMDGVVRDATMAGVAEIVPVVTERSVVGLSALGRGHAHERWQRVAIASAKQCGRARLAGDPSRRSRSTNGWTRHSPDVACCSSSLIRRTRSVSRCAPPSRRPRRPSPASSVRRVAGPQRSVAAAVTPAACLPAWDEMTFRADAVGLVAVSLVNFAFDGRAGSPLDGT